MADGDINATIVMSPHVSGTMRSTSSAIHSGGIHFSFLLQSGEYSFNTIKATIHVYPIYEGTAELTLPMISVEGEGVYSGVSLESTPTIPALTLSAEGRMDGIGDGAVTIPRLGVSGIMTSENLGVGAVSIPHLTLSAEGGLNALGVGAMSIPMLSLSATMVAGGVGTFAKTLPSLKVSGTGYLSIDGTGAVTIPMLTISIGVTPQTYLNMVMNIRNRALSLYTNYDFNSLCRFNKKHYGANGTAIYDLDTGDNDDGTLIEWNFRTGHLDLDQKVSKKLKQARISYKSSGDLMLKVVLPDGTEYEYDATGYEVTEDGIRVKFGKGIRSKYVALDVSNIDGASASVDVITLDLDRARENR